MPDDTTNGNASSTPGWMTDVQRAIAMMLIGAFAIATMIATICSIFWPQQAALIDMAKTLQAALVNMSLIALGFFFGNNQAKAVADAGQQKIVEKLTSTAPPTGGPVAPLAAPVVVVAWWSLLTEAERTAITAAATAAPPDARAAAFMAAAQSGKASSDDLTYLVAHGLLTQDRATAIATA